MASSAPPGEVEVLGPPALSDPELISRVRDGGVDAYGTLFERHRDAATRLARMLAGPADADDLVSDSFMKVLNVLLSGGGPDIAFRAYLLTAVRRLHVDKVRATQRLTSTGDMTPFDPGVPFTDTAVAGFEGGAAARAFASLPERWQMVLWHLEVENQKPADIAALLGMTANSVSALAYRAREGLRQAFLTMHAGDLVDERCRETNDLLGGYVRGALSRRDAAKVDDHLEHCRRCTAVYLELYDVNSSLAAVLGPALLGPVAAGYLGAGTAGAGGFAVVALFDRVKDFVAGHAAATTAGAAAVGVAAVTALVVTQPGGPADRPAVADPPQRALPWLTEPADKAPAARRGEKSEGDRGSTTPGGQPGSAPPRDVPDSVTVERDQSGAGAGSGPQPEEGPSNPGSQPSSPSTQPGHPEKPPRSPAPAARTVDLRISARPALPVDSRVAVTVLVLGMPSGAEGSLVATASAGTFRQLAGPACRHVPRGYSCPVGGVRALFVFSNTTQSGPRMTFRVIVPDGWTDPNPANNTVSVLAPHR